MSFSISTDQLILVFTVIEAVALVLLFLFGEDIFTRFIVSPRLIRVGQFVEHHQGAISYFVGDKKKTRKVHVVTLRVFNESRHKASEPWMRVYSNVRSPDNSHYRMTFYSILGFKQLGTLDLEELPTPATDDILARVFEQTLLTPIDEIRGMDEDFFVMGFAFEDGKDFFFIEKSILTPVPFGETLVVGVAVGCEGRKGHSIVKYPATLRIEQWDRIMMFDSKGKPL